MKPRNNLNKLIAFICALVIFGPALVKADEQKQAGQSKIQLMFVQTADDFKADDNTLRLINMGQQTLYFSDRPVRIAGHLTMPAYMDEWKAGKGPNNFSANPPNATLSVYEAGRNENTLAVVEISHPVIDGKDLVYKYKLIKGPIPKRVVQLLCSLIGSASVVALVLAFTVWEPALAALACSGRRRFSQVL